MNDRIRCYHEIREAERELETWESTKHFYLLHATIHGLVDRRFRLREEDSGRDTPGFIPICPIVDQKPFLDKLPIDIVLCITDELLLSTTILLAQTCKSLHSKLYHECDVAVQRLSLEERTELFFQLHFRFPNHRFCIPCQRLHILNYSDFPAARQVNAWPCTSPGSTHDFIPGYNLGPRHVQLAIQCAWSQCPSAPSLYDDYLARLMQRFTYSSPNCSGMMVEYIVKPVLIDYRFLLMVTIDVSWSLVPGPDLEINICPHLRYAPGRQARANPLQAAVCFATKAADKRAGYYRVHRSCDCCQTDYSVTVKGARLLFHVWQDLGYGTSDMDRLWRVHMRRPQGYDSTHDDSYYGHKSGSIRRRYYRNYYNPARFGDIRVRANLRKCVREGKIVL